MSKIPRAASPPEHRPLKRKAADDGNPALSVLRTSTAAHNNHHARGPPPLTKPRAPLLATSVGGGPRKGVRAVSAPPAKGAAARAGRAPAAGAARLGRVDDERFTEIRNQMTQMESVRAADLSKGASLVCRGGPR